MIQMDALVGPIAEKALADGVTIAVAESLTCGALVNALGAGESSSEWLAGGVAAYMMSTKVDVLGVTVGIDPCSAQCAEELAVGVRTLLRADVAMSTTGVGGPDPEDGHEPGTVFIGWATGDGQGHVALKFEGGPEEVLEQSVATALRELADVVGASSG